MRLHRPRPLRTTPTVSVVVPCYRYGHYLPAAVASALDQPGVEVEVIVVDDASPDDSADVARSLAAADPRIRVLVHEHNRGHIQTYNDGLDLARGTYVALLSADDLLTPGSLTRAAALMEAHPEVGLVYGFAETFQDEPPALAPAREHWAIWEGEEWLARICARGRNIIVNPEALMRTSVLRQIGGYDPEHPYAADMQMWMRAATIAQVGRINGPAQACYREHGANMHLTQFAGLLVDLGESGRVFESFFDELAADPDRALPRVPALRERARAALAREALQRAATAHGIDGAGPSPAELAAFAASHWPPVVGTRSWQAHERRVSQGLRPGERYLLARAEELRWKVRWRRWRRWGT
ncbi:glycosyltransferase [Nocardioides sp. dk4132]|uniref:glycosyltransferase family 2 protein n=1 Tax=unclassified Nocardioides TaxID=2615069 RepID=UPI001297C410|nr:MULTISPECIES: glycosyltransferase family 2 protein [unclassified Nocardioides]MQW74783.1 glycosyltransferase [Nocardioides sp. dk4132]QGA06677.1 glycosyltransferase [Nocardioides sp. dk884]